jgi:spore maturation protein CgeB
MRFVYFSHSLRSCWNHGNAHFQRGVLRELAACGHEVRALEPANAWSRANLVADHGELALHSFEREFPELRAESYVGIEQALTAAHEADVAIVHEWNDPALLAALGRERVRGRFRLLFHDTHHRAVSDPEAIRRFDLGACDAVLAFGETLAAVYRRAGWGARVFVWHEAADTRLFRPPAQPGPRAGLVWIGNWGDGERSSELEAFLLGPARAAQLPLAVFGVRYPEHARRLLSVYGAGYHGWIANTSAPAAFARHLATVHVPRRFYVERLPGIPTIRVFEALACGIPLVCAPWEDSEGLFRAGEDYLIAATPEQMTAALVRLRNDAALRQSLARSGEATIRRRHSCAHRAQELLAIIERIGTPIREAAA